MRVETRDNMNEYNEDSFVIGTMTYSFSRVNNFDSGCKYEWKQHYIMCEEAEDGFYGAAGGFAHEVLEKYANRELDIFDISPYFEEHFSEAVPYNAPSNKYKDLKEDWYEKVLDYFNNIDLPIDDYEVIGVEKQVNFDVNGYPFIGFIDLLLRDPADGKLILCDHKSSSIKILKSGKISKSDQQHFLEFRRQQYLYSKAVIEEFGEGSVKELWWNMFRDHNWIKIAFNQEEYLEAQDWALDVIHRVENETEWEPREDMMKAMEEIKWPGFYCMNLCCIRSKCPYRSKLLDEIKGDEVLFL
jgi:hypothetical protein